MNNIKSNKISNGVKRFVFVLVCFFLFVWSAGALSLRQNISKGSIVKLESTSLTHDIGRVKKDSVTTKTILLVNKLDRALNIQEARSSCGCMRVKLVPKTLERNGIIELEITLDTVGFQDEMESVIYILTDDMKYELISLTIISHIVE